jgi:DNA modification methylase
LSGFRDTCKEKRISIKDRLKKCIEILEQKHEGEKAIIWHTLEDERKELEKEFKGRDFRSVYGAQKNSLKEKNLIDFSENKYQYLFTKPQIAGSGCNFQNSHIMVFLGINDKFNDFIQAIHRQYRYGQKEKVYIYVIHTDLEEKIFQTLERKWAQHKELNEQMINLVRKNGLNSNLIRSQMERQIFENGSKFTDKNITLYNNDTVIIHNDKNEMPDNSVHLYVTSIPFGDHYEYSDNYNDFGHNHGNKLFFQQMDYLIENMYRCLQPGRIACIHVKDRIRYSYQNGTSFTTISDFSGNTVRAFEMEHIKEQIEQIEKDIKYLNSLNVSDLKPEIEKKENELSNLQEKYKKRFYLLGKITVTTDVVAENNQTYRLGWTEQTKDASKMGVGLPEYVLIFRKPPTNADNSYSDNPVNKDKSDYTKALWQLDAHAYERSSGDRFLTKEELSKLPVKTIAAAWKKHNKSSIYDFVEHLETCEYLDEKEKLSSTFMTLHVHSNNDMVWTDVNRMNTLNAKQVSKKKEKHICPLQFDIIERLINRFSKKGELVCDPFSGLHSTGYKSLEMGRKYVGIELNTDYFLDGLFYIKSLQAKLTAPTLFDFLDTIQENEVAESEVVEMV